MRSDKSLLLLCLLLLLGACAPDRSPAPLRLDDPTRPSLTSFAPLSAEEFAALPETVRAARAAEAERRLEPVRLHRRNRFRWIMNEMRMQRSAQVWDIHIPQAERRLAHLVRSLEAAVAADPTHTSAWLDLAHDRDMLGDAAHALAAYEGACRAASHDARLERPEGVVVYATTMRAWRLRDLGRTDEGLALMEAQRAERGPGGLGARLCYGLLLGDAGRFREAYKVSMDLPPVEIPDIHLYSGINPRTKVASYARNWLQAVAWLGIGEPLMARHALRDLNYFQLAVPYKSEYWQDVGLIHELAGDVEEARTAYSTAFSTRRAMVPFMNWDSFTTPPLIADVPDVRIPAFTTYDVHLAAGSRFTLGAQLVAECSQAPNDSLREYRGRAAEQQLGICIARGIRPLEARALRGRVRYHMGERAAAEADLRAACADLAAAGRDDAGSLLILGTLLYQDERVNEALPFLERATRAEPDFAGPWRTLGAALAALGRDDEALAALDRAVELEPGSSQGWHNRGYFHATHGNPEQAAVDLGVALRIAPGNPLTLKLARQVAQQIGQADGGRDLRLAQARSDSLAAAIPSVAAGRVEESPGRIALGPVAARTERIFRPVDYAALADSLDAALRPDAPRADLRRLADALLRCGREDEVAPLLDADAASDPADLILLLRADRSRGDPSRALRLVRDEATPDVAELWSLAGLVCLEHDHREAGLLALEHAIVLDPENTGLRRYREFVVGGR